MICKMILKLRTILIFYLHCRAQQILEEKLDKYSVRRQPLGLDRHHRRYWYGLGGDWSKIYIEDEQGHWRIVATVDDFEVLVGSLDVRGVRELALMQALEKVQDNVVAAMKKAAAILQKSELCLCKESDDKYSIIKPYCVCFVGVVLLQTRKGRRGQRSLSSPGAVPRRMTATDLNPFVPLPENPSNLSFINLQLAPNHDLGPTKALLVAQSTRILVWWGWTGLLLRAWCSG